MAVDNRSEEDILKTMSQLLALAEQGSGGEAENALVAYQRYATRYSIEMRTVEEFRKGRSTPETPIVQHVEVGTKGNRAAGAFSELLMKIAGQNDVKCIYSNSFVDMYGFPSDIKASLAIYHVVVGQMVEECISFIESDSWRAPGVNIHSARRSFYSGFISRVVSRLRDARIGSERETASEYRSRGVDTALVLRDKRRAVNELWLPATSGLKTGAGIRGNSQRGRAAGSMAGDRARLFGAAGNLPSS